MPKASEIPVAPPETLAALPSMPPPMQPGEMPSIAQLQAQLAAAQAAQQQQFIAQQAAPPQPTATVPPPPQTVAPLPPMTAPPVAAAPVPQAPVPLQPQVMPVSPAPTVMPTVVPPVPQVMAPTPVPPVVPQAAPVASVSVAAPVMPNLATQMEQMGQSGGGSGIDILKQYDLAGIETNNFRLLPLDVPVYEGRITKAELGKSSTGFNQIKLTVKTCYPSLHAGVTINDYVTIQPNTMWKYKSLLLAAGLLSPDGARFAGNSMQDFIGKIVQFQIKHDAYDGEMRNKINGGYSVGTLTEELVQPSIPTGAGAGVPQVAWAPPSG